VIGDAVCVCYRTGFRSAKGQLIVSLLTPKYDFLNFFEDLLAVVAFMFVMASLIFIYQGIYLRREGESWSEVFLLYLDTLTDAIPVGLAICLLVSTSVAFYRLRKRHLFVSESAKINMAGITTTVCFDKTGTFGLV
jgi:P-type E1-E2 ATPase